MRSTAPRKKTNRIEKVNSLLEHILGRIIFPYLKPLGGIATISKVSVSRDMKYAKVWISVVGAEDDLILGTLAKNIYDIQGELNGEMETKIVPRISFELDTSARHAQHINELFKKIHEEQDGESVDESNE